MAAAETILLADCTFSLKEDFISTICHLLSYSSRHATCKTLYQSFILCLFTLREFVVLCGCAVTIQYYEIPYREAGERQVQRNRILWSPFCSAGAETACMVVC